MRVLALDLSTKTGFAVLDEEGGEIALLEYGCIEVPTIEGMGEYPQNFVLAAEMVAEHCGKLVENFNPDLIAIEDTNGGRFRYSIKILEFIHSAVLRKIGDSVAKVRYVNTGEWRGQALGLSVTTSKKRKAKLKKQLAAIQNDLKAQSKDASNEQKKALKASAEQQTAEIKAAMKNECLDVKIDKKSIAVAYANVTYGLSLKKANNDAADAICLGTALAKGCKINNNYTVFGHEAKEKRERKND